MKKRENRVDGVLSLKKERGKKQKTFFLKKGERRKIILCVQVCYLLD